jgi:hypothetical protein
LVTFCLLSAKYVTVPIVLKVGLATVFPPDAASNQTTVASVGGVAIGVKVCIGLSSHSVWSPPLVGAFTTEQLQSGEVIEMASEHEFAAVTVTVMSFPEVIPEIVQLLPPLSVTVPSVDVTDPLLTSMDTE